MNRWVLSYAWASLRSRPALSLVVVLTLAVLVALPLAVHESIAQYDRQFRQRAEDVPLILVRRGNRFDHVLSAVFFEGRSPASLRWADAQGLDGVKIAPVILGPLVHPEGDVQSVARLVGTDGRFFASRPFRIAKGVTVERAGEAVVGAAVARRWKLEPGDRVRTLPEQQFDVSMGGQKRIKVVGILEPTGSADDHVVFVNVYTTWALAGFGHSHEGGGGHEHQEPVADVGVKDLSESNLHFHGAEASYPVSALWVFPDDVQADAVLQGRYLQNERLQMLVPEDVMRDLMDRVFRIKRLYDQNQLLVAVCATALLLALGSVLLQTRREERHSLWLMGISRTRWLWMVGSEWAILFVGAVILGVGLAALLVRVLIGAAV